MKKFMFILLLALCLGLNISIYSQDQNAGVQITAEKISDNIYILSAVDQFEINVVASIGPDGILLVDAGSIAVGQRLGNILDSLSDSTVKYIINTHFHNDHTGGNRYFQAIATIISQSNVAERMAGKYYALTPQPEPGTPDTTFEDEFSMIFNGEEIRVKHFPSSHTDCDAVVYFTKSNVACLGDLLFPDNFPYVDVPGGGDVDGYYSTAGKIIEWLPKDVKLVPSHGRIYTIDEMRKYQDMLAQTIGIVRKQMAEGKSLDEMTEAGILNEWEAWGKWYIINPESWIRWIHQSLTKASAPVIVSICQPLTETIMTAGIDDAVKQYHSLKAEHAGDYIFDENELNNLGYQLMARNMLDAAVEIFKLNIEAYPESANTYDSMGEAYMKRGDKELAIRNYEKSLELNPGNDNAKWALEKLRGE
ncbi:MAG: MBL fold metallo-hydrolase [Candidatus Zixiibacteriota bacterium]